MRSDHITEPVPPALSRGGNQRQPALSEARKEPCLGAPAKLAALGEENNAEKAAREKRGWEKTDSLLGNVKDGRAGVRGVVRERKEKMKETHPKKRLQAVSQSRHHPAVVEPHKGPHLRKCNLIQMMSAEQCHRGGRISLLPTQSTPLCCEICEAIKPN